MKLNQLFEKNFQENLKEKVEETFFNYITDIKNHIQTNYQFSSLSDEFSKIIGEILVDKSLDTFSPIKFYWLNLLDDLFLIADIHDSASEKDTSRLNSELSEIEDEIFTFWNDTDFAETLQGLMNDGLSIFEASEQLIPMLENQIITLFLLHCTDKNYLISHNLLYTIFPEIGDSKNSLRLGEDHKLAIVNEEISTFPTYSFVKIDVENAKLEIESENKIYTLSINKNSDPTIKLLNNSLSIIPTCDKGANAINDIAANIEKAVNILRAHAPDLLQALDSFTHTIVIVDEPGIVSYSMQELPGYSSINTFERDFVDLIDDLLHENGHHFLNAFLNISDLIEEDDEKIYYSAWRRQLRPIRGIYHAFCTFYWAFHLFKSLSRTEISEFSSKEVFKIKRRLLEEFLMLKFTYVDLKKAFGDGKMTDEGMEIIEHFNNLIVKESSFCQEILQELKETSPESANKIFELENHLNEKREHYGL